MAVIIRHCHSIQNPAPGTIDATMAITLFSARYVTPPPVTAGGEELPAIPTQKADGEVYGEACEPALLKLT